MIRLVHNIYRILLVVFLVLIHPARADQLDRAPFDIVLPHIQIHEKSLPECLNVIRKHLPPEYSIRYVADPAKLHGFTPQTFPKPSPELKPVSLNVTNAPLGFFIRVIAVSAGARIYQSGATICVFPNVGTMESFETNAYPWKGGGGNFEAALKRLNVPFYSKTKIEHANGKVLLTAPREVHDQIATMVD